MWIKLVATIYLSIFIPSYWIILGWQNFLWFSDIAVILTVFALWLENALIISAMATGVLAFEVAWITDFLSRLLFGMGVFGPAGTSYMFDEQVSLYVRGLSLSFHILLPITLLWGLHILRYDSRAWYFQTLLAWIVYPICYWFTDPHRNINWGFGPGTDPQLWMPGYLWVLFLMFFVPVFIFLPTHLLLKKVFHANRPTNKER